MSSTPAPVPAPETTVPASATQSTAPAPAAAVPAPEPTVTAPAPQPAVTVTTAPEMIVPAPAKQSALARFGFPLLGLLTVLVFINIVLTYLVNNNVGTVTTKIVAVDNNVSEFSKIANNTSAQALALAKQTVVVVEKVDKTLEDSRTAMVAEGNKNRAMISQLADHVGTLVTKVKEGDMKTQGDIAELQKGLAVSTKQSSDALTIQVQASQVAQVAQATQIASKLDEIKAQLASVSTPAATQATGVSPSLVSVDPTRTPTQVSATPKSDILSGTQGGSSGEASSTKTEWKRYEISANVDSKEFSARKARNGDIRLEMKGQVTLIQRFSGWSNRRRESASTISRSGYTVLMDADTVAFRSDDKLIIWEKEN